MRSAHRPSGRRGNYAVLFGISLTAMLGFAALAIDVPYAMLVGDQLQNGLDASAHAAVMQLDGTDEGVERAEAVALAFASGHQAGAARIALRDQDLAFGTWEDGDFLELADPEEIDAIRITNRSPVASLLSEVVFERGIESVQRSSVAVTRTGGASATECFLPMAIPSCLIDDYGAEGVQDVDLVLNPPGSDNVGWARPFANPNASWARAQIWDCMQDGEVAIGDEIDLNNGVMNSAMQEMADAIAVSDTAWDPATWGDLPPQHSRSGVPESDYGATLEGPMMVFEDDSYCGGSGRWNETKEVTGFVWAAIYDVATSGKVADRTIRVRLEPTGDHKVGNRAGGPDLGVQASGGVELKR